ncbi:MAG: RnfABCDGE type electron transport complex subunit A [Oscillospiraceae bacterium]|nr:RnfABCDGE type electron transport complex subunit A [Oscillospiraceae bacterium]
MEIFKNLMYILMTSAIVENVVLAKFLGICPFLGVSKKLDSAIGMSGAVIFVMLMATAVTYPIYAFLLVPNGLAYLQTIVFILVIAALVQLVEFILKKYMKALYQALGVYLPLITTNCAVLGVTILNFDNNFSFVESLVNAAGTGLGFMIAMVLFAGVRSKMESCDFPESFKGIPSTLIAASIVSMSFMGFADVANGIFM